MKRQQPLNKRFLVLPPLCVLILSLAGAYSLTGVSSTYNMEQFSPKNDPTLSLSASVSEEFLVPKTTPIILSLSVNSPNTWSNQEQIALLETLNESLYEIDEILDIKGIHTVPLATRSKDQLQMKLLSETDQPKEFLSNKIFNQGLVNKEQTLTSMVITPDSLDKEGFKTLTKSIDEILQQHLPKATYQYRLGGPSIVSKSAADLANKEIVWFALGSLLLAAIVFIWMFKGIQPTLICLSLAIFSNLIALGALTALGLPFTVLTNIIPTLVTITVISLCSHTLSKFSVYYTSLQSKSESLVKTYRALWLPHTLTAATTVIGFFTLYFSDIPVISEFGIGVCLSVLSTAAVVLGTLPFLLTHLAPPTLRDSHFSSKEIYRVLFRYRKPLLPIFAGSFVVMMLVGTQLNWSPRLFDDLPLNNKAVLANQFIEKNHGGSIPMDIVIGEKTSKDFWIQPENVRGLSLLQEELRGLASVGSTTSFSDFMELLLNKRQSFSSSAQVSETLLLFGMSEENPIDYYLSPNRSRARIDIRLKDLPANVLEQDQEKIRQLVSKHFPLESYSITGSGAYMHPLQKRLSKELIFGFIHAMAAIFVLLTLAFRSPLLAGLSLIPNLVPPLFLLSGLALFEIPIKPALAMVFSISLGIAFDNTVYLLSRLKSEGLHKMPLPSLEHIFSQESGSCFLSGLSLILGFAIFLFSSFSVNTLFGALMIASVVAGLIGDLILLPTLLAHGILINKVLKSGVTGKGFIMNYKLRSFLMSFLFLAALGLFSFPTNAASKMSAQKILDQLRKNNLTNNETAKMKMVISERDGSKKTREFVIKKKNGTTQKALIKIQSPAELKNVGLLSVNKKTSETQWLFLPSEKRSRQLSSSSQGGNFLDSDLSYEDLSIDTYRNFTNKVEKMNKKGLAVILSTVKDKSLSSYSKIRTWVDVKKNQIIKAEYFNKRKKMVKKIKFSNYKKYGKIWRSQKISVDNLKKKRSTQLLLKGFSLKKIPASQMTKTALEEV